MLYAIPDFVSMLLVQRMALTTKVHHICVVAFMVTCLYTDFGEETVLRAVVVYAVFRRARLLARSAALVGCGLQALTAIHCNSLQLRPLRHREKT